MNDFGLISPAAAARLLGISLTLPRFHVHQTHAAFRLRSKSAGDR